MPTPVKQYMRFVEDTVQKRLELDGEVRKQGPKMLQGHDDMLQYVIAAKDPETGVPAISREDLIGEANILIITGTDTTSVVLTGFFFYATRSSRVLSKLTNEIRSSFSSADDICWG